MNYLLISSTIGLVMGLIAYFIFVWEAISFKREWKNDFNEEHPDIKNPYKSKVAIITSLVIFLLLLLEGIFANYISTTQDQKDICINTIQEWQEQHGLSGTEFKAYVNNEYTLTFERPSQYNAGDCLTIYKYPTTGWTVTKI